MAPHSEQNKNKLFLGSFIHSKTLDELEYLHNTAVFVDGASGKIVDINPACDQTMAEETVYPELDWDAATVEVVKCEEGQFFFPGFIDTHIHAPQYPNSGIFGKSTLLDWLNKYTFPMEASLSSLPKARRVYSRCIQRTLRHGTTTAAYYATIHVDATNLLADLCLAAGQRAFIGRVCMDNPDLSPAYYRDEGGAKGVIQATQQTISHMHTIDPTSTLLTPILTPRFAPSCTRETLAALGKLHQETQLPVQTHISENQNEIELVKQLFPEMRDYASVYDFYGLLTPRTVLAHAIHLSEAEASLIAARGSGVSHCPCSNAALASGEARVRWLLDRGVRVGLGTDVSGGYSGSVLEAARQACLVSRHLAMPGHHSGAGDDAKLSVEEALYLATRGGAEVVGLRDRVGYFGVGMEWDAQLVGLDLVPENENENDEDADEGPSKSMMEMDRDAGNADVFGWETCEERVAKWLYTGDDRNTKMVWVRGRLVHSRRVGLN